MLRVAQRRLTASVKTSPASILCRLQSTSTTSQTPVEAPNPNEALTTTAPKEPVAADIVSGAPGELPSYMALDNVF